MPLFDMFYRDTIMAKRQQVSSTAVVDEFDNLSQRLSGWALREHNEDGTHNVRPSGFDFVPIGSMTMWGGSSAPDGWLLCDGSQVSRTTFQTLFNVLGTTYGVGDGSTTFNLPDLRQRFPLGKAAAGTGSTLGSTGGAIDHTHSIAGVSVSATGSTSSDGGHSHGGGTGSSSPGTNSTGGHTHSATTSSDGDHAHNGTTDANGPTNHLVAAGVTDLVTGAGHTHDFTTNTTGAHSHTLTTSSDGSHSHTVDSHSHSIGSDGSHTHSVSVSGTTGSGTSGTANAPFVTVNYIILTGV
jgi:microcystin-dependent protein